MTGVEKLKAYWNEYPLQTLTAVGFAAIAVAKLVDAASAAQGRRAYARQINYKINANR